MIFWFPVRDIKIPDIFYKIQHFLATSWASVIAHKYLLDLIIWMQTAPLIMRNYNVVIFKKLSSFPFPAIQSYVLCMVSSSHFKRTFKQKVANKMPESCRTIALCKNELGHQPKCTQRFGDSDFMRWYFTALVLLFRSPS